MSYTETGSEQNYYKEKRLKEMYFEVKQIKDEEKAKSE